MLPGTCPRAVVPGMLCALSGFAARGGRCSLAPVIVPWLWPGACLSGVPRGPCVVRRASSGPVALGALVGFPEAVALFPTPGAVTPGFTGHLRGARGGRPRTGLIVPAAGPRRGRGAGLAPCRTRSGPRDGVVPGGSLGRWSLAACAVVVGVCGPGQSRVRFPDTVRWSTGDLTGAPGLFRVDADTSPCGSEDATPGSCACTRVLVLPGWVGRAGLPGAFWCASPLLWPLCPSVLVLFFFFGPLRAGVTPFLSFSWPACLSVVFFPSLFVRPRCLFAYSGSGPGCPGPWHPTRFFFLWPALFFLFDSPRPPFPLLPVRPPPFFVRRFGAPPPRYLFCWSPAVRLPVFSRRFFFRLAFGAPPPPSCVFRGCRRCRSVFRVFPPLLRSCLLAWRPSAVPAFCRPPSPLVCACCVVSPRCVAHPSAVLRWSGVLRCRVAVFCAASGAVVPRLALSWAAVRGAVFVGAAFSVLCCAFACCCVLRRVSGRAVRLRCSRCGLLSGFGLLPRAVRCCVPGCGAACYSARRCAVVCCVVWFRSLGAAACCAVPSGAACCPGVLCFAVFCGAPPRCVLCAVCVLSWCVGACC